MLPKLGLPFAGPYSKDYSILGSVLGSHYLGKLPYTQVSQNRGPAYGNKFVPMAVGL